MRYSMYTLKFLLKKFINKTKEEGLLSAISRTICFINTKFVFLVNKITYQHRCIADIFLNNNESFSIKKNFKVSIIVPSYCHAEFLYDRLDSIYNQTYNNYEVILLDDNSNDGSQEILTYYYNKFKNITKIDINKKNSGCVFAQWEKGIKLATGDLIMIAESDDWADINFLEQIVPLFYDESVMIAYGSTDFMKDGEKILDIPTYLGKYSIDFTKKFTISAHKFVSTVMGSANAIPNVSGALFRNIFFENNYSIFEEAKKFKLCGDWLIYLYIMRGGAVSFNPDAKNFYRIHNKSTSLKVQKTLMYYREFFNISSYIAKFYKVDADIFCKIFEDLKIHNMLNGKFNDEIIKEVYNVEKLVAMQKTRQPNIAICTYAMVVGGGEIFPIHLANELKKREVSVTFFDFSREERNNNVRNMLRKDIPLVLHPFGRLLQDTVEKFGIEVIHSHHGVIDTYIMETGTDIMCSHVVSLHGFYEAINKPEIAVSILRNLSKNSTFVYTANKNLNLLELAGIDTSKLIKIPNGLEIKTFNKIERSSFGINDEDFVLCLATRALPEKGWSEAVKSIIEASKQTNRKLHLIMIGEGEMYDELKNKVDPKFIHLIGFQYNLRGYFAMSNMGFLPSRYLGESFPLINLECLLAGKPIIASAIGEIPSQLTDENGEVAGALFDLDNWSIDINKLAKIIVHFAEDKDALNRATKIAIKQSRRFSISEVAEQYNSLYNSLANKHWFCNNDK